MEVCLLLSVWPLETDQFVFVLVTLQCGILTLLFSAVGSFSEQCGECGVEPATARPCTPLSCLPVDHIQDHHLDVGRIGWDVRRVPGFGDVHGLDMPFLLEQVDRLLSW